MNQYEVPPTCSLCGQPMFWEDKGEAWSQPGWQCNCEEEPTEYAECSNCGYSGPIGGACDECAGEIGS